MRKICLSLLIGLSAGAAYSEETSSEGVVVTGSRIPFESAGLIAMSGSGVDSDGNDCAEPNCGMGPEDPSGGRYTSIASKNQRNKQAKQKAQNKPAARQAIKNTDKAPEGEKSMATLVFDWLREVGWTDKRDADTETPSGKVLPGARCKYIGPAQHNPCVERRPDVEKVQMPNGTVENQLQLSYVFYEQCYYENKCGPDYITFVAGSEQELKNLLNDAIGEKYF